MFPFSPSVNYSILHIINSDEGVFVIMTEAIAVGRIAELVLVFKLSTLERLQLHH